MPSSWRWAAGLACFFLALFGVVEALELPLLTGDPVPWLSHQGRSLAALVGVLLLLVDVLLPVPSSLVMVGNGALFGFGLGAMLSLVGGVGAALVGFALGRWGSGRFGSQIDDGERHRADDLLRRWGDLAVVASRPVPILAETVAILAGTGSMGWGRFALASFTGCLPAALLYAWAGASARGAGSGAESGFGVFGLVLALAGLFWWFGRRISPPGQNRPAGARSQRR